MIRTLLFLFCLMVVSACSSGATEPNTIMVDKADETYSPDNLKPLLDIWQHKTFEYFYNGASATGLAFEGNEHAEKVVTIGGSGFGVMALIVGAERGWITRTQAAERVQKIIRFLGKASRFKGAWSHWYDEDGTSHPFGDQVSTGDLVETSFMMAGLVAANGYFTGTGVEKEIRDSVDSFWNTVDWQFYTNGQTTLNWLYYSEKNEVKMPVSGWNECLITYILALGAPSGLNISDDVYKAGWLNNGNSVNWNRFTYGYKLPLGENTGGPLFFSHYSFLGLNPLMMEDNFVNYWQQNTAHTMINRHYCLYEAPKQNKYANDGWWGLTACNGVGGAWYSARSPSNDDGIIAPTASLSAYPYTPFYSTQMLFTLNKFTRIQGRYGFGDAYSPSKDVVDNSYLAIDEGPIVVMIENYRSGLIWNLVMKDSRIRKGLQLAGMKEVPAYKDGFIRIMPNTYTNEFDMIRHPDRRKYELNYFVSTGGNVRFSFVNLKGEQKKDTVVQNVPAGENVFSFMNSANCTMSGKRFNITMTTSDNKSFTTRVFLR